MSTEHNSLDAQFQAAAEKVNNLPAGTAAEQMTDLYGLYKQATEGDVDMKGNAVSADEATLASGPAGLSQAQWESWNKYKGTSQEEAKRQYVARATDAAGGTVSMQPVPTDEATNAPQGLPARDGNNTTTAQQPNTGPGVSATGGLRGDITAGAPYGGEDKLKGAQ